MESDSPSTKYHAHRHLLTVLSLATVLVPACISLPKLWASDDRLHFSLLGVALLGYVVNCCLSPVHEFYGRHNHRGYFLISFGLVALVVYASQATRVGWMLALPIASQAIMNLPLNRAPRVVIPLIVISFSPFWPVYPGHLLGVGFSFGVTLIFSGMIRRENDRRRELETAHEQLRLLSAQAEAAAAAEERARLAREIHDGVAHHLTSAHVLVEAGAALLPADAPAAARDTLAKAQGQIRSALAEIRASIAQRHHELPTSPLPARLEKLILDGNFPATLAVAGPARRLAPEAEQALYRVAQEALTNAGKHAPGAAIQLRLDFTAPARVQLHAENAEPAQPAGGDGAFGLLSLRERMTRLGGTFTAGLETPGRFVVRAELPA